MRVSEAREVRAGGREREDALDRLDIQLGLDILAAAVLGRDAERHRSPQVGDRALLLPVGPRLGVLAQAQERRLVELARVGRERLDGSDGRRLDLAQVERRAAGRGRGAAREPRVRAAREGAVVHVDDDGRRRVGRGGVLDRGRVDDGLTTYERRRRGCCCVLAGPEGRLARSRRVGLGPLDAALGRPRLVEAEVGPGVGRRGPGALCEPGEVLRVDARVEAACRVERGRVGEEAGDEGGDGGELAVGARLEGRDAVGLAEGGRRRRWRGGRVVRVGGRGDEGRGRAVGDVRVVGGCEVVGGRVGVAEPACDALCAGFSAEQGGALVVEAALERVVVAGLEAERVALWLARVHEVEEERQEDLRAAEGAVSELMWGGDDDEEREERRTKYEIEGRCGCWMRCCCCATGSGRSMAAETSLVVSRRRPSRAGRTTTTTTRLAPPSLSHEQLGCGSRCTSHPCSIHHHHHRATRQPEQRPLPLLLARLGPQSRLALDNSPRAPHRPPTTTQTTSLSPHTPHRARQCPSSRSSPRRRLRMMRSTNTLRLARPTAPTAPPWSRLATPRRPASRRPSPPLASRPRPRPRRFEEDEAPPSRPPSASCATSRTRTRSTSSSASQTSSPTSASPATTAATSCTRPGPTSRTTTAASTGSATPSPCVPSSLLLSLSTMYALVLMPRAPPAAVPRHGRPRLHPARARRPSTAFDLLVPRPALRPRAPVRPVPAARLAALPLRHLLVPVALGGPAPHRHLARRLPRPVPVRPRPRRPLRPPRPVPRQGALVPALDRRAPRARRRPPQPHARRRRARQAAQREQSLRPPRRRGRPWPVDRGPRPPVARRRRR